MRPVNQLIPRSTIVFLMTILCLQLFTTSLQARAAISQLSDEALTLYHQGIGAQTVGEREQAFEKALALYLAQYNRMKERDQINGLLCYNIGNCYFNLEQNAQAIFYYQLAKKLLPLDQRIAANLKIALEKRENSVDLADNGIMSTLLFFHFKLSASQQIKALITTSILTTLALLLLMLRGGILVRYLAIISGVIMISLWISLAVDYYLPTNMGILMRTTDVRRGAGRGFAPITPHPLGGGSSVMVTLLSDGWYKIRLNDGQQGFIPREDLKLVTL